MSEDNRYYIDTSALLPYYREESVSRQVNDLLVTLQSPILISDLIKVEFASAVARWNRTRELNETHAHLLENTFNRDIASGLYLSQQIAPIHFTQAERWLLARSTSLRTLDALHLACAWGHNACVITCDEIMHNAADILGIKNIYLKNQ